MKQRFPMNEFDTQELDLRELLDSSDLADFETPT